ncbi:MAG: hypothetical protein NTV39_04175 [Candidatus Saccharibacteria bacterium]|nr:hypothetical protein [Candidatus Saccharibacteria bacterium]
MKFFKVTPVAEKTSDYVVTAICTCGSEKTFGSKPMSSEGELGMKHLIQISEGALEGKLNLECPKCMRTYQVVVGLVEPDDYESEFTETTKRVMWNHLFEARTGSLAVMTTIPSAPGESMPAYRLDSIYGPLRLGDREHIVHRVDELQQEGAMPVIVKVVKTTVTIHETS